MPTNSMSNLEIIGIGILIIFLIYFINDYLFGVNISAVFNNENPNESEIDIYVNNPAVPEIGMVKQVFNIPENKYNYKNAKAVCQAYGSRLANYKEVEAAYNKGADWCNYGWSEGQMALFPTQYDKWEKLQDVEGHEHDCGRPGINGGFIDNPNAKYGINCFGYKPKMTSEESELMETSTLYPETKEEIRFNKSVEYWKTKISDILVSPFNNNSWSVI